MISQLRQKVQAYTDTLLNESCLRGEPLDESLLKQWKANSEKSKKEKELKLKALNEKKIYINLDRIPGELAIMEKRMEGSNKTQNIEYLKKEISILDANMKDGKYLDEQKPALKNYKSELQNLIKIHSKK